MSTEKNHFEYRYQTFIKCLLFFSYNVMIPFKIRHWAPSILASDWKVFHRHRCVPSLNWINIISSWLWYINLTHQSVSQSVSPFTRVAQLSGWSPLLVFYASRKQQQNGYRIKIFLNRSFRSFGPFIANIFGHGSCFIITNNKSKTKWKCKYNAI